MTAPDPPDASRTVAGPDSLASAPQPPGSLQPHSLGYAGLQTLPTLDNSSRARSAITWLKTYAIIFAIQLGASLLFVISGTMSELEDPQDFLSPGVLFPIIVLGLIGLAGLVVFVLATVYYTMWQYRAYWNHWILSGGQTRYSPGWSVGWWFIPIANLFVPKGILSELWTISGAEQSARSAKPPWDVYLCWVSHFLLTVVGVIFDVAGQLQHRDTWIWTSFAFDIAAGVVFIAFLWLLARYVKVVQDHQPQPTAAG